MKNKTKYLTSPQNNFKLKKKNQRSFNRTHRGKNIPSGNNTNYTTSYWYCKQKQLTELACFRAWFISSFISEMFFFRLSSSSLMGLSLSISRSASCSRFFTVASASATAQNKISTNHTCTHKQTHTHMQTFTHAKTHACTHTDTSARVHTCTQSQMKMAVCVTKELKEFNLIHMTEARPQLLKQLAMAKGNIVVGLKQANNGFEIKVKGSTEGWEYNKLNLVFNSSLSQKANLYKIEFLS